MKALVSVAAMIALVGCATHRDMKEVKMIAFDQNVSKGKSEGQFEADDCVFHVLGYRIGGNPDISRAIANTRTMKKSEITDVVSSNNKGSGEAIRYANNVTAERGGFDAVVALNAQVPMRASQFVTQDMIDEHHERLSEEALEPARKLAEKLDVKLACAVANASPAEAIVNFVRKGDEIVMGTRGMGRVGNLLMGSVATRVVHLAEVPVTLVK